MADGVLLAAKFKLMAEFVGFGVKVETIERDDENVTVKVACLGESAPEAYINWDWNSWQVDIYAKPQEPEDTCIRKQRFNAASEFQTIEATFVALLCQHVENEWSLRKMASAEIEEEEEVQYG